MKKQLDLNGISQATYPIRVYCRRCGHLAELRVGIETLHSLDRLRCSRCGCVGRDIRVEMVGKADLGG